MMFTSSDESDMDDDDDDKSDIKKIILIYCILNSVQMKSIKYICI